jgi:uncharacterized protein (DUF1810 family)
MASGAEAGGELAARFLAAQNDIYPQVLQELRAGQKRTHWMWFVFPQIAGLGQSEMARRFALGSMAEAATYFSHPILGARLRECTEAVLLHAPGGVAPRPLSLLFGYPDDAKFRSSMTLFHRAVPDEEVFTRALGAFWNGAEDEATISKL